MYTSIKLGTCIHKMLAGKLTYKNHYQIYGLFRSPKNPADYFPHSAPNVLTFSSCSVCTNLGFIDYALHSPSAQTTRG